jgi:hypothetical protein
MSYNHPADAISICFSFKEGPSEMSNYIKQIKELLHKSSKKFISELSADDEEVKKVFDEDDLEYVNDSLKYWADTLRGERRDAALTDEQFQKIIDENLLEEKERNPSMTEEEIAEWKKDNKIESYRAIYPVEQYRNKFPQQFLFYDAFKDEIEHRIREKEKKIIFREKFDGEPQELRAKEGFWDSVRILIGATPDLLAEVSKQIEIGKIK